jgi:hypothetical protein
MSREEYLRIYPDANIWSYLSQQAVDEKQLVESLASKHSSLVLSAHAVYELARTFTGKGAPTLGIQLFSSLQKFLDLNTPCSKEFKEFIKEECYAFENGLSEIHPMLDANDHEIVRREVSKLANGVVEAEVKEFIEKRTQSAASTRTAQKDHFVGRDELRRRLKTVKESQLPDWLARETLTAEGIEGFYQHLSRMLGAGPTPDYARGVLLAPSSHAARGLVRADLYSNWRCANRDSNPKDLIDDMTHALQAMYCDVYATAESKQSDYASLLLTARTKIAIYDGNIPIDRWLESLT